MMRVKQEDVWEGGRRTEKTIKKKGRKWSNISVKKYHHRPVFGVRSGRVKLEGELGVRK